MAPWATRRLTASADPVRAAVDPVSGFRQSAPDEGQPATERTEVRILFTDDTIYFGIVCYDKDPSGIIVSDSRRDSSMNNADSFQMVLDTFSDRQNGFVFGTTPAGQEYDGQVTDEGGGRSLFGGGGGGGFSRGSGGGFNLNWDGAWQVREDLVMPELGMPRDLSGDGVIDDQDHSLDYVLLPARIQIDWRGAGGDAHVEFHTVLMGV